MTNEAPNTKPRRRWLQFSLRTLLIVVTVSAVPLGWVGWKLDQARRQRVAVAWVETMGGGAWFGGGWVDSWFGLGVSHVSLTDTQVSDLSPLSELEGLDVLRLNNTPVSDLSPLAELKKLQRLSLNDTQVSDLSPLTELESLKVLYLENTQVSDLSPLAELKNLRVLWLVNTQVSEVSPLAKLKNLERLWLDDTQVSDEQVQKLQQALPNCRIFR